MRGTVQMKLSAVPTITNGFGGKMKLTGYHSWFSRRFDHAHCSLTHSQSLVIWVSRSGVAEVLTL